jgi:hypothetical protein
MYRYVLHPNGRIYSIGIQSVGIELTGDEPFTIDNAFDYLFDFETKTWIYDPIIMVPQEITKLQCVEQLRIDDKYDDLMAALKLDETGWDMIRWEAASILARDSQMVAKLTGALGMTSDDVDTFFINASKIYL